MPITIPHDLGAELTEASRWYAGEAALTVFSDHVRAGHSWSERRPRALLRWADRHSIAVFGSKRFILMMNAGFDCPGRWRSWRAAVTELRRALDAIADGSESELAYADGRSLLAFGESGPRRWGPIERETAMTGLVYPSLAGEPSSPAGSTPSSSPSSPGSSAVPQVPHGGWLTRQK
jgi:hypothetical protein